MWCEGGVHLHSFACGHPVAPATFVERTIFLPSIILIALSKINWPRVCFYFWFISGVFTFGLMILFHRSVCLSLHPHHIVLITEVWLILFKAVLAILLNFHMNFWISLSISAKKKTTDTLEFGRVCIVFVDQFGENWHPDNIKPYDPWIQGIFSFFCLL